MVIEGQDTKQGEQEKFSDTSGKVFLLLNEANERSEQLIILEKTLQEKLTTVKKPPDMTDPRLDHLIHLQAKMQEQIIHFQELSLQQHNPVADSVAVKLPKLELPSYN